MAFLEMWEILEMCLGLKNVLSRLQTGALVEDSLLMSGSLRSFPLRPLHFPYL